MKFSELKVATRWIDTFDAEALMTFLFTDKVSGEFLALVVNRAEADKGVALYCGPGQTMQLSDLSVGVVPNSDPADADFDISDESGDKELDRVVIDDSTRRIRLQTGVTELDQGEWDRIDPMSYLFKVSDDKKALQLTKK